jgi:hypothetical protein
VYSVARFASMAASEAAKVLTSARSAGTFRRLAVSSLLDAFTPYAPFVVLGLDGLEGTEPATVDAYEIALVADAVARGFVFSGSKPSCKYPQQLAPIP